MKKLNALRWTAEQAASEFGKDARSIAKRLKKDGVAPGEDGRYSTQQIASVIFSKLDDAKLRKAIAEAKLAEMEVKKTEGSIVDVDSAMSLFDNVLMAIKRVVLKSKLPREDQDDILREMQHRISRIDLIQVSRGDGTKPDEDEEN